MAECVMICIDNSDWMRNGDFGPSRFEAQKDAINAVAGRRIASNQKTSIGIISMAGFKVEVCLNPTNNVEKIFYTLHGVNMSGKADFIRSVQTARLVLKHRLDKAQKQRIICFVGSPLDIDTKSLEDLGKSLKKNNVSVDIIALGQYDVNTEKLRNFFQSVNNRNNSNLLECDPETCFDVTRAVCNSPIGDRGASPGGEMNNLDTAVVYNEFGVDPNQDPDLYLALRLSMQEQTTRQEENIESGLAVQQTDGELAGLSGISDILVSPAVQEDTEQDPVFETQPTEKSDEPPVEQQEVEIKDTDEVVADQPESSPEWEKYFDANISSVENEEKEADYLEDQVDQKSGNAEEMRRFLQGLSDVDLEDPRIKDMLRSMDEMDNNHAKSSEEEKKSDCEES